jgi:Iap family predicted aminopeptidase
MNQEEVAMTTPLRHSALAYARFFGETVGPRPVGSPAYAHAAATIRQQFAASSLTLEEIQYECVTWEHHGTLLELNGAYLTAEANVFSPSCDVKAPVVPLGTPAELEQADIAGRIVVFYGDLSAAPLIPLNSQVYNTERDQRINRLLAEKQPAALITVNLNHPALDGRVEDADMPLPSATVPAQVGLQLLDHAGEPVRLKIDASRPPAQATSIIGRKDVPGAKRVTLMAHYDTKVRTRGAVDNGSGAGVLLALAERLAPRDLPFGLEFIAFGDEEYYSYSDGLYVERHGQEMADILVAINMDAVGQRLGTNTVALMSSPDELQALVNGVVTAHPGVVWTDPWPESNHSTFAYRGVPSIALSSRGVNNVFHQPQDTIEWLDEGKLEEVVALVEGVVGELEIGDR